MAMKSLEVISSRMQPLKMAALLLCSVTLLNTSAFAQQKFELLFSMEGAWKFSIGDNESWAKPSYEDKTWETVKVPSSWEDEGFYGYDGYAWYRTQFYWSGENANRTAYIVLSFVDDVDEVFLNGEKIGFTGSFPPDFQSGWNAMRKYYLPKDLLKVNQNNSIAVRIYDAELSGGILPGPHPVGIYADVEAMNLNVNLAGTWKFRFGDNESWKDPVTDESSWRNIIVPSFWEGQYADYDGFAWYRKSFDLPENLSGKELVLCLGKIDDIDEVYVNGRLIGSTGSMKKGKIKFDKEYQYFRGYYIPRDMELKPKGNVIAVRVFDGFKDGGIYEGPIGIITSDKYIQFWNEKRKRSQQTKRDASIWERLFGKE